MGLHRSLVAAVAVVAIHVAIPAEGSCGFESLSRSIARDNIAAVFSGTVVGVQFRAGGHILTFKVDTVWKGEVSGVMLVYHASGEPAPASPSTRSAPPPSSGIASRRGSGVDRTMSGYPPFELTRRYVVIAHRVTDEERALFKLDREDVRFGIVSCGGMAFEDAERIGYLAGVGRGSAPRDRE